MSYCATGMSGQIVVKSGRVYRSFLGGFRRLRLPEDEQPQVGDRLVVFDRDLEFCQFEVTRVYADGCVKTTAAIPWPERERHADHG